MRQLSNEKDESSIIIYHHYKLIMRPEKRLDDVGVVRPDVFCNDYSLVAELEACKHTRFLDDNFVVKNISIANHRHDRLSKEEKPCPENNNNFIVSCEECHDPSSRETNSPESESSNKSEKRTSQPRYSNTHLSVADALLMMRNNTKHLGVLFANTSFVRLRLQGRPIDLPPEKKFSGAHGLAAATERALRQVELLHDEIKFLHEYALKCEDCDKIVAGDILVEQKETRTSKMPTILIVSVLVVVVVNNCFFKFPSLSVEF